MVTFSRSCSPSGSAPQPVAQWFSTHPLKEERIQNTSRAIEALPAANRRNLPRTPAASRRSSSACARFRHASVTVDVAASPLRARRSPTARARFARRLLARPSCWRGSRVRQRDRGAGDRRPDGRAVNGRLPLVRNPPLNPYVTSLGRRSPGQRTARGDYRFYIINSPAVNAFALPGGHVYVTRGLIERTESGTELAAVLAHEIGHVAARHGVRSCSGTCARARSSPCSTRHPGREPELLDQNALRSRALSGRRQLPEGEREADRLAVGICSRPGWTRTGS